MKHIPDLTWPIKMLFGVAFCLFWILATVIITVFVKGMVCTCAQAM